MKIEKCELGWVKTFFSTLTLPAEERKKVNKVANVHFKPDLFQFFFGGVSF